MAMFEVIKYEGPNDVLVWQWPGDEIGWGSQVIVNQTQEVLFYKNGQALDLLGPGRHTLQTANIPILREIFKIPFGKQSPFKAEVYFIDKAVLLDAKWGTQKPMPIMDPVLNIFLPVQARGQFGFRVSDSRKLVVQLVGTVPTLKKEEIINYFRGVILTKTKDYIATRLIEDRISILTVSASLQDFSESLKVSLKDDFAAYGLDVINFFVNAIDVPEDDPEIQHVKKAMADKAEYRIMGSDAYRIKRTFDVLEAAARNEGGGAGYMGAGLGLGMGMGAGGSFGTLAGGLVTAAAAPSKNMLPSPSSMISCPSCQTQIFSAYKFCTGCGSGLGTANAVCPECSAEVPVGAKFCGHCGLKWTVTLCPKCGKEIPPAAKFCQGCGAKMDHQLEKS
ncbi:MAG: SPFH domain-containing protein [bacterium]